MNLYCSTCRHCKLEKLSCSLLFNCCPGEAASSPHRGPRVNAQMMTSLPSPLPSPPLPFIDRVCAAKACPGRDTNSLLRLCEC